MRFPIKPWLCGAETNIWWIPVTIHWICIDSFTLQEGGQPLGIVAVVRWVFISNGRGSARGELKVSLFHLPYIRWCWYWMWSVLKCIDIASYVSKMNGGCNILNHQQCCSCQNAGNTLFYPRMRKYSRSQWREEAVAEAVGPAISGSCRRDTSNVANILSDTSILIQI